MKNAINIDGASPESVAEARKAVAAILKSTDNTIAICAALAALQSLCAPTAHIENCQIYGGPPADKGQDQ